MHAVYFGWLYRFHNCLIPSCLWVLATQPTGNCSLNLKMESAISRVIPLEHIMAGYCISQGRVYKCCLFFFADSSFSSHTNSLCVSLETYTLHLPPAVVLRVTFVSVLIIPALKPPSSALTWHTLVLRKHTWELLVCSFRVVLFSAPLLNVCIRFLLNFWFNCQHRAHVIMLMFGVWEESQFDFMRGFLSFVDQVHNIIITLWLNKWQLNS